MVVEWGSKTLMRCNLARLSCLPVKVVQPGRARHPKPSKISLHAGGGVHGAGVRVARHEQNDRLGRKLD
jgi:hypothetical protein